MQDDIEQRDDEDLNETEQVEDEAVENGDESAEVEQDEGEGAQADEGAAQESASAEADDALVVTLGDDAETDEAEGQNVPWVRTLRKQYREVVRERDQLQEQLRIVRPQAAAIEVGEKPTLASCDYDETKFETALENWTTRKSQAEAAQRKQREAQEENQRQWTARLEQVKSAAKALKIPRYEESTEMLGAVMSPIQMAIINNMRDPKKAALMNHALAVNPAKAQQLASITNPVEFALEIGALTTKMEIKTKKLVPPPDKRVTSGVAGATAISDQYERLSAKAEKTGDRTEVARYLREKQRRQAA